MDNHPIGELMGTTMQKIREMVDVNTIIGSPITTPDGITVIPVSKVSFGFASGGSDFHGKNQQAGQSNTFGGGAGAGVNIVPVAFLVIKGDSVRVLNIAPPATTTLDRALELAPEIVDKVGDLIKKNKKDTLKPDATPEIPPILPIAKTEE
ncbi:MAG: GerW family sporulation protein [Oscillospiraceae bacterium]|nr:GerW family sporulation protein [Oscillospiraceae bacterium]